MGLHYFHLFWGIGGMQFLSETAQGRFTVKNGAHNVSTTSGYEKCIFNIGPWILTLPPTFCIPDIIVIYL